MAFHKPWTKERVVVVLCFGLPRVSWARRFFLFLFFFKIETGYSTKKFLFD